MKRLSSIRHFMIRNKRSPLLSLSLAALCTAALQTAISAEEPKHSTLSSYAFPALGMPAERKVDIAWNRFYDTKGLHEILVQLNRAFPNLTKLYSIGKSIEGRDLWCLEVTARNVGNPDRKPGMYIDGNIHGNEVQGSEVVAYTAWYLCHQYGRLDKVTDLLDHNVFYLFPTINPDGRDNWFHRANNAHTSRTGMRPFDNDRDGRMDEDDYDDLDGDGSITTMRIKDPNGRYKPHPNYPEFLMVQVPEDQKGEYSVLGWEGIDNDGDGRINEDVKGGYDMNRNWGWDWQPNYIQFGAQEYPFSLPETRALADFVIARPNIAGFQSYHNFGGMILRSPGREGGVMEARDERVMSSIAQRGEKMLPFYRSMIIWKDLYTVWGGEVDWLYGGRGIIGFTTELWTTRNLNKTSNDSSQEEEAAFQRHVMLNEGMAPWKEYDHPTYGKIEVGGPPKNWGRTPPSFLLEEECHRNMAFTLYHAEQMPRLDIRDVEVTKLGDNLFKVWVTIDNSRTIPTRTGQDVRNHISPPDIVTLTGNDIKVITSGRVTDRFFKKVEAVKQRPERVELETILGMSEARVQFIISGRGNFTVRVNSAKGGDHSKEQALP